MSKLLPIWQHLPLYFKQDVVGLLDHKSRLRLQMCSKAEHHLVSKCPFEIEQINIEIDPPFDEHEEPPYHVRIDIMHQGCYAHQLTFQHPKEAALHLSSVLAHRKTICKTLNFPVPMSGGKFLTELKNSLKYPMRVRRFKGTLDRARNVELLRLIDSRVLRELFVENGVSIERGLIDELVLTEQWKRLEVVTIDAESHGFEVKDFLGFRRFSVLILKCDMEGVEQLIESFRSRPLPIDSCFHFIFEIALSLEQLTSKFANFHQETNNPNLHLLSFPLKTAGLVLNVQFGVWEEEQITEMYGCVESVRNQYELENLFDYIQCLMIF